MLTAKIKATKGRSTGDILSPVKSVDSDKANQERQTRIMRAPVSKNTSLAPIPLDKCLAKSFKKSDDTVLPGRLVLNHCQIVGEVARAMISRMPIPSRWCQRRITLNNATFITPETPAKWSRG